MKFLLKNYMLFFVYVTLVFVPVQYASAKTEAQKSSTAKKKYIKKASYKKSKARKLALAKQRANDLANNYDGSEMPKFSSSSLLVVNQNTGEVKFSKNANTQVSIASITKLMTAMVVLDSGLPLHEMVTISKQDIDRIKNTRSRLPVGTTFSRDDMLKLALISSENRAAYALSRHYPGGRTAFIKAMNAKALSLGLMHTKFSDPTGLMPENRSTAEDLYQLVAAAYQYPFIRNATTTPEYDVTITGRRNPIHYRNTNVLVRKGEWDIGLSKTGFINEAGRCLVMQAKVANEPLMIVLLDAAGTNKRTGDAIRVRKWLEQHPVTQVAERSSQHVSDNEQTASLAIEQEVDLQPKLVMTQSIYDQRYDQWLAEMGKR